MSAKILVGVSVLFMALPGVILAQEKPAQTILECTGMTSEKGIDAPADEVIAAPGRGTGTYAIESNAVVISGNGSMPDARLGLCGTTSTTYIYSNDCTARRTAYIQDWMHASDFDIDTSPFFKKYSNSVSFLQTVVIDRVSLHLTDELLLGHVRTNFNEATRRTTQKPFMTSDSYDADCTVAKPKI